MSASDLVQVGSDLFVMAADVVKIYRTNELPEKYPTGCVYVVSRSMGFSGPHDGYRTTDWPIEKVLAALGITPVEQLEQMVEEGGK
ncbi:hypothetical protein [Mycobacteroides franklinii]|uniref:hypothetical protein n=1 Tax=Mycobacteroides franklinii TaxID=948102 RepID=UPI000993B2A7|nr:hypothetical protein [Mycobacteroides franklinii]